MVTDVLMAMIRIFLSIAVLLIEGQDLCSIEICLTWKVTLDRLTLICRLNNLKHRVYIDNQHNKTVGDCFSTNSPPCESYHSNGSIQFKKEKQQTIFTVKGQINDQVNGNWTCRHGLNKDIAIVDVTVLTITERGHGSSKVNHKDDSNKTDNVNSVIKDNQNKANGNNCIAALLCWFVGCFVIFMILIRLLASISIRMSEYGIDDIIDKCTLRLCTFKRCFKKKSVNVRKNIFLLLIIIVSMGIVSFIGYSAKGKCSNLVIALVAVFGCLLGMSSSIFIISIEDKNNTGEGNGKQVVRKSDQDGENGDQDEENGDQDEKNGQDEENGHQDRGNGNQVGRNGHQVGGNGKQDGRNGHQDGGNGNQDGKNGNQDERNGYQDGGNGSQDGKNGSNQDGGNGNQGGGNGNQGGRNGNQDGENGNQDGGNGNQDGGNGNQDGRNGNQDGRNCYQTNGGNGNQTNGKNENQANEENDNKENEGNGNQTNEENGNQANEENGNHDLFKIEKKHEMPTQWPPTEHKEIEAPPKQSENVPTHQSQPDHQQNTNGENIENTETQSLNNPKKRICKHKRQTKEDESIKEIESSKKPFLLPL